MTWQIERILDIEGGRVDDESDAGGRTNWGLTERWLKAHGEDVDPWDISRGKARTLIQVHIWEEHRIYILQEVMSMAVLDAGVLCGVKRAIRWLQRIAEVKRDGILGPETAKACWGRTDDILPLYRLRYEMYLRELLAEGQAVRAMAKALDIELTPLGETRKWWLKAERRKYRKGWLGRARRAGDNTD